MKLLDRYLMAQFTRNLLLVLTSLTAIYLLVDFFERVDNFLEAGKSTALAIRYLLLKLPQIYEQLIPACILLAGVLTLGVLNRHMEFMALMAGGISARRIILPLLVAALLCTVLTVAVGQWILPVTTAETNRIWFREVNRQIPRGIVRDGRTYFHGEEGIFSFVQTEPGKNIFSDFTFAALDQEQRLKLLIGAKSANWENGVWHLTDGQIQSRNEQGGYTVTLFKHFSHPYSEGPAEFFLPPYRIKELSYQQLFRQAQDSAAGKDADLEFHRRLSYALLGIPLLLLGLPVLLAVHRSRGRDLALAIPISCGLAFSAWAAWSFGQSMARAATLPVAPASWTIHLLASTLGCFLISRYNRQSKTGG